MQQYFHSVEVTPKAISGWFTLTVWLRFTFIGFEKHEETKCCVTLYVQDTVVEVKRAYLCRVNCCESSQYLGGVNNQGEAVLKHRDFWVCLSMLFLFKEGTSPKSLYSKAICWSASAWVHLTRTCTHLFRVWWCVQLKLSKLFLCEGEDSLRLVYWVIVHGQAKHRSGVLRLGTVLFCFLGRGTTFVSFNSACC